MKKYIREHLLDIVSAVVATVFWFSVLFINSGSWLPVVGFFACGGWLGWYAWKTEKRERTALWI